MKKYLLVVLKSNAGINLSLSQTGTNPNLTKIDSVQKSVSGHAVDDTTKAGLLINWLPYTYWISNSTAVILRQLLLVHYPTKSILDQILKGEFINNTYIIQLPFEYPL